MNLIIMENANENYEKARRKPVKQHMMLFKVLIGKDTLQTECHYINTSILKE